MQYSTVYLSFVEAKAYSIFENFFKNKNAKLVTQK